MKVYVTACKGCDNNLTIQIVKKKDEHGYQMKCLKCGRVNPKYHTKTFLQGKSYTIGVSNMGKPEDKVIFTQ